jgi:hypothetical protein
MSKSTILLVNDPVSSERLLPQANKPWLRLLSCVFAYSLDRRLASGLLPESKALLAARAEKLVSPQSRLELAQNWQAMLERASKPLERNPRVPLCRDRIVAAESDIREMISVLSASRPSSARGVAMVSRLLSDGEGPLYNRHAKTDLHIELLEAIAELDSAESMIEFA